MAKQIDVNLARENIQAAIEAADAHLAELRATEKLIAHLGEDAGKLFDVLTKFGKAPLTPQSETPIAPDLSDKDAICQVVTEASQPSRVDDVIGRLSARKIKRSSAHTALAQLVEEKRLRRMAKGLYWGLNKTNGHTQAKALPELVKDVLKDAGKPLTMPELRALVETRTHVKGYVNGKLAYALRKLGKHIKHHGSTTVGHTYELR
jgi:hypothetical protein